MFTRCRRRRRCSCCRRCFFGHLFRLRVVSAAVVILVRRVPATLATLRRRRVVARAGRCCGCSGPVLRRQRLQPPANKNKANPKYIRHTYSCRQRGSLEILKKQGTLELQSSAECITVFSLDRKEGHALSSGRAFSESVVECYCMLKQKTKFPWRAIPAVMALTFQHCCCCCIRCCCCLNSANRPAVDYLPLRPAELVPLGTAAVLHRRRLLVLLLRCCTKSCCPCCQSS